MNRRLKIGLRQRYERRVVRAILATTPAAASQLRLFTSFIEQVGYHGRRLAKLNVPPDEVSGALDCFDGLLARRLAGAFAPAREQLRLVTEFALGRAYYEVREAEAQAFFGLYRAEAEALNLEDLLQRFVRVLTGTFGAAAGRLITGCRDPKLNRPLYIGHGEARERLLADPSMRGQYAGYWSYPVGESGLMQFAFPAPYPWLPRELILLDAAACRCSEAIERACLRQDIRRLEMEARQAESEERRRIGRDLHDEAGQSLLLMRLKLEMLERTAPSGFRPGITEVREMAEAAVGDLRRIIAALSPAVLERLGLRPALQQLASRFRKMHGALLHLRIGRNAGKLPREIEEVIYRVAQECLQNVAKHSDATRVNLFLRFTDKSIRLGVRDNGTAVPKPQRQRMTPGFGLAGMRDRATLLGGTLAISSSSASGFSVRLDLPRNPAAGRNG